MKTQRTSRPISFAWKLKNQFTQPACFRRIAFWLLWALIAVPCTMAGTFRDDFTNEKDFLEDKQLRVGGVWGEDISAYSWENGALKADAPSGRFLLTGDLGWQDYTVECRVKILRNDRMVGLVLRRPCIDCNTTYVFGISAGNTAVIRHNTSGQILDSSAFQVEIGRWYSLKAVAAGENLEFYIDNKLVAKAKNGALRAGKAGLSVQDGEVLFEDFIMTGPKVTDGGHWSGNWTRQEDTTPPARITDLEAIELQPTSGNISYSSLKLRWTAPGDDDKQDQAQLYDILYSNEPITDINDLTHDHPVLIAQIPEPAKGGEKQTLEIAGLGADTTYYFAIRTYDDGLNTSLSNILEVKPPLNLFSDATHTFEFGVSGRAPRAAMAFSLDVDLNGLTDLYLADDDLYINVGSRRFVLLDRWELEDRDVEVAAVANYDNSGGPDILFMAADKLQLHRHTDSVYLNVTEQAGLPSDIEPEWMTFADVNGDNWLDIYMSVRSEPSRVYLNNGDGTFTESAQELGLKFGDAETVIFSDLNGDNRVDAYVSGDWVYIQKEDGQFTKEDIGIRPDPDITAACVGDYDNDGHIDVYVTRRSEQPNSLYRNTGAGQFEEVTQQTRTGDEGDGVSANFVDINNDGRLDLYVLNEDDPSVLYIQQPDGTFKAHRDPEALDLQDPNSAAFGDFDGDGDVDIYVTDTRERGRMYRNNHEGNHWLHVKVVGTVSNRDALGARVYVTTPDGIQQMREVRSQTGWSSDSLPVEFGLGAHTTANTVDIRWPSGQWQSLHNVSGDQVLTVEEGGKRWATTWGDIRRTALLQNFPNSFNPETWIPFVLADAADVSLTIYDGRGQLVRHLELGNLQAGAYTSRERAIYWNGRNETGERVASGVYFYRFIADDFSATRKMVILK